MNSRREWWQTNNYHVSQRLKTICSLNVNHNKLPTLQLNVVCQRSRDFFKNGRLTAFHHYPEVLCRHKTILTELNFHLLEDNIPEDNDTLLLQHRFPDKRWPLPERRQQQGRGPMQYLPWPPVLVLRVRELHRGQCRVHRRGPVVAG